MSLIKYIFNTKYRQKVIDCYSYEITKKMNEYDDNIEQLYSDINNKKII